tara:strand:+ start:117 stop:617 length:501 start_codon:yes stop_codon:yes gene_type:complete
MINKLNLLFVCIIIIPSLYAQTIAETVGFDKNKIINIFDYPKLYLNKLYFCQAENETHRTFKIDLYNQELTVIVYNTNFPKSNLTLITDIIDVQEGKNNARFKLNDSSPDETKFPKWTLNKDALIASYLAYDSVNADLYENDWIGPFDLKCYQELPPSLSGFKSVF